MKWILMSVCIFASVTVCGDYKHETVNTFERSGYTQFGFNHEIRSLLKEVSRNNNVVKAAYVQIYTDHYLSESESINCSSRMIEASDQYESWNGEPEKHYVVGDGWSRIVPGTIQAFMFRELCN